MPIEEIGINGFVLKQDNAHLKLGTDAVLLSDFARIPKNGRVCDLGCGCGAVSILIAARRSDVTIVGVEIIEQAAATAEENIALNHLADRMEICQGDFKNISALYPAGSFDAVVSNPPYLPLGSGLASAQPAMVRSKMEVDCTIGDVCRAAAYLLQFGGVFSLVYRPERLADLFQALRESSLEPKRLRMVQNNSDATPSLVLVEARKGGRPGLKLLPALCIRTLTGQETPEVQKIYHRRKSQP